MQGLCLELDPAPALTLSLYVSSSFNNYFVLYFMITVIIIEKWLRPGMAPLCWSFPIVTVHVIWGLTEHAFYQIFPQEQC